LNSKRSQKGCLPESKQDEATDDGSEVRSDIFDHIQMVTSLIEGRHVGLAEIHRMLNNILRQHSIDRAGKPVYADLGLEKTPP